jgi:hypothetical protein
VQEFVVILDRAKIDSLTFQILPAGAYEVWDTAGAIAREMLQLWPELALAEGMPHQQTLSSPAVTVQTGFKVCTITLARLESIDELTKDKLVSAFKAWRTHLKLDVVNQLSTRVIYGIPFETLKEANSAILGLELARRPSGKMFEQAPDSARNSIEVGYRFEDDSSFSVLRFRTEEVTYEMRENPQLQLKAQKRAISKLVIEFDRGLKGEVKVSSFRVDEWLKGLQHVLRRDIEKLAKDVS